MPQNILDIIIDLNLPKNQLEEIALKLDFEELLLHSPCVNPENLKKILIFPEAKTHFLNVVNKSPHLLIKSGLYDIFCEDRYKLEINGFNRWLEVFAKENRQIIEGTSEDKFIQYYVNGLKYPVNQKSFYYINQQKNQALLNSLTKANPDLYIENRYIHDFISNNLAFPPSKNVEVDLAWGNY